MFEHLGGTEAAAAILTAVEDVLARGGEALIPDMGGSGSTESLGERACKALWSVAG